MTESWRTVWTALVLSVCVFVVGQIVSVHFRSNGGILCALECPASEDNVKGIGFPRLIWEAGRFAYLHRFNPLGLVNDVVVATSAGVGLAMIITAWRSRAKDSAIASALDSQGIDV